MEYKKSKYNQIVYYEKQGKWYIHNIMNDCYMTLTEEEKSAYEENRIKEFSTQLYNELCEGKYLTDIDEIEYLRNKTQEAVNNTEGSGLKLVICPTMGCNFACPYCVETGQVHAGRMNEETIKNLMRFFDRLVDKINPVSVSVTWYGGEPLLGIDIIEELSKHFKLICRIKRAVYQSNIITNGYFLDEEMIDCLEKSEVISYRVTVDGPERIHNQTRVCKNGEGSYQTIFKNLRKLCEKGMHTEVRCNVSKNNIDAIGELEKEIEELKKIPGSNITLHFARMMVYRDVPKEQQANALTEKEYSDFYTSKQDYKKSNISRPIAYSCGACDANSFTIDEAGNIYKCNSFIGKKEYMLGNVSDLPSYDTLFNHTCAKSFREKAFPERKVCQECFLLPICMGSCPANEEKRCNPYKHHPERILFDKLERENGSDF